METAQRIQEIKRRLVALNEVTAKLDREINHQATNNHLLGPVRTSLRDIETLLLQWVSDASNSENASMVLDIAEFELSQSAERLIYAQDLLIKYGAGVP